MNEEIELSDFGWQSEDKNDDLALYAIGNKEEKEDTKDAEEQLENTQELVVEPDYE